MIFIRTDQRRKNSTEIKAKHHQRCAKLFAILAVILLILLGIMLYLAITTQYSEQKTTYYVLFVFSLIGSIVMCGLSAYQVCNVETLPPPRMHHRLSFINLEPPPGLNPQQQHVYLNDQYFRSQLRYETEPTNPSHRHWTFFFLPFLVFSSHFSLKINLLFFHFKSDKKKRNEKINIYF